VSVKTTPLVTNWKKRHKCHRHVSPHPPPHPLVYVQLYAQTRSIWIQQSGHDYWVLQKLDQCAIQHKKCVNVQLSSDSFCIDTSTGRKNYLILLFEAGTGDGRGGDGTPAEPKKPSPERLWDARSLLFSSTWCSLTRVKRPGCEADHSNPYSAEVKNKCCIPTLPYTPSYPVQGQIYPTFYRVFTTHM